MSALLAVNGVSKSYPGVRALDRVNLSLEAGEIHALVGENGAGKSSLIKILTGVIAPDEGEIVLGGAPMRFARPRESLAAGIAVVHQERNLIPRYSVAENMFLDRLPTRSGVVQHRQMQDDARRWLDVLELAVDPATPVRYLSVAQMQLVEIGRALSLQSKVLLLDEPTASITEHEVERLIGILRRLRDQGTAILFVSHKLEEVISLCDRITVLRDGQNTADARPLVGMSKDDIVTLMVGREAAVTELGERTATPGQCRLELSGVATAAGHEGIDLKVHAGEVVGLYGLVGAGRTELAKALLGAYPVTAGSVRVDGKPARIRNPLEALRRWRLGYVSEDRKGEGLILAHSVTRNTAITVWHRLRRAGGLIWGAIEKAYIRPLIERLDVRTPSLDQAVGNLSGGNQQKVSVAKWLAADTRILIIDEPTVGVDVRTKGYLHRLVWKLADEGTAVVLITSELAEMIQLADRIYVMNRYRIVGDIANSRDYDAMSGALMQIIQADNDRRVPPATAPENRGGKHV
jgi:ribose transport system ATP-binding protein